MACKGATENGQDDDTEDGNGYEPSCARNSVVDTRSSADKVWINRAHNGGGQGCDTDRHTDTQYHHSGEIGRPVAPADTRKSKEHKAQSSYQGSDDQGQFSSIAADQSS